MTPTRLRYGFLVMSLSCALLLSGCQDCPVCPEPDDCVTDDPLVDPALNGAWVDDGQSVRELRFDDGDFEWLFDDVLQQRGVYDTKDGVLTVTIQQGYGTGRLLGYYSGPYSIVADTLTWDRKYTKK